ncbi:MAG: DUF4339 domain-containing protein [Treponema sp.]|nr:DUF4339 domain-containing protein [Treponema sp.]
MIKKVKGFVCAAALCLAGQAVSAYEFNLNYLMGMNKIRTEEGNSINYGFSPFGIGLDNTWWSKKAKGIFVMGFDLDLMWGLSGAPFLDGTKLDSGFSMTESLSAGPAMAWDFGKSMLRFTPGLQFTLDQGWGYMIDSYQYGSFYSQDFFLALSLNVQYHYWFKDKLGINAGLDLDVPLFGSVSMSMSGNYDSYGSSAVRPGIGFKIFAGLSFRKSSMGTAPRVTKTPAKTKPLSLPPTNPADRLYTVIISNEDAGPLSFAVLGHLISNGVVTRETLVWRDGLADWVEVGSLVELKSLFSAVE